MTSIQVRGADGHCYSTCQAKARRRRRRRQRPFAPGRLRICKRLL